jgi:hypothetical protein
MAEMQANKPGPAACWTPCARARILLARPLAKLGQPGGGRPLIGLGQGRTTHEFSAAKIPPERSRSSPQRPPVPE